jgi:2-oxoglutarate dehydrogenase E2 component (dihydrolipoamide succinyltransferase)
LQLLNISLILISFVASLQSLKRLKIMAKFELKLPKMGESVAEATINSWLKEIGDKVEVDESVIEISTDKVDSDVPSEVSGILIEKKFNVDDVVEVGETFAIIETDSNTTDSSIEVSIDEKSYDDEKSENVDLMSINPHAEDYFDQAMSLTNLDSQINDPKIKRFYSPLVKNIAKKESISDNELNSINGSGKHGRVTKKDILNYVADRSKSSDLSQNQIHLSSDNSLLDTVSSNTTSRSDEIIEMTRMGKLISKHMVNSLQTSAHVQSFIEVDVTKIWDWREGVKLEFQKKYAEKITFTPIFMEAVAIALSKHPMLNISVDGESIIKHKDINLGMATALSDGNLIVPVIKQADQLNLIGMVKRVNDLAHRARENKLNPDDIKGGTYTVTNVGGFGSIMGTPIINQPQVGILALGAIRKVPAVVETNEGDFIGIRQKMFLSHSYDHRVVNGALGGQFLKTVKDILESWDVNRQI